MPPRSPCQRRLRRSLEVEMSDGGGSSSQLYGRPDSLRAGLLHDPPRRRDPRVPLVQDHARRAQPLTVGGLKFESMCALRQLQPPRRVPHDRSVDQDGRSQRARSADQEERATRAASWIPRRCLRARRPCDGGARLDRAPGSAWSRGLRSLCRSWLGGRCPFERWGGIGFGRGLRGVLRVGNLRRRWGRQGSGSIRWRCMRLGRRREPAAPDPEPGRAEPQERHHEHHERPR